MLKTVLLTFLAIVLAVVGGAGSVWMMLEKAPHIGAVTVGPWTTYPAAGTPQADPYSRARLVRQGGIPLGPGEGIDFQALRDSAGEPLDRSCSYRVDGAFPAARFWTLYVAELSGAVLPPLARRHPALHSDMLLRRPDNGLAVTVSRNPTPANWLAVTGEGPMQLVLSLFDSPVSTGAQVTELVMPQITRISCDA